MNGSNDEIHCKLAHRTNNGSAAHADVRMHVHKHVHVFTRGPVHCMLHILSARHRNCCCLLSVHRLSKSCCVAVLIIWHWCDNHYCATCHMGSTTSTSRAKARQPSKTQMKTAQTRQCYMLHRHAPSYEREAMARVSTQ